MFPNSFSARVAERIVVWGALIGFLLFLYGAIEIIPGIVPGSDSAFHLTCVIDGE